MVDLGLGVENLERNFFKPLAGFTTSKNFEYKPSSRGMNVKGKTEYKDVLYKTQIKRNISVGDGYNISGKESYVEHVIFLKDKKQPFVKIKFEVYNDEMKKSGANLVYDFINDFDDFVDSGKSPERNFTEYYFYKDGESFNCNGIFDRKLVEYNSNKGVLHLDKSERKKSEKILRLTTSPKDKSFLLTTCDVVASKKSDYSLDLKKILEPFIDDLRDVI